MITKKPKNQKRTIDLTGEHGNAFFLLSVAENLTKQLGLDYAQIAAEMTESDYENLIQSFDKHFGQYITLYR